MFMRTIVFGILMIGSFVVINYLGNSYPTLQQIAFLGMRWLTVLFISATAFSVWAATRV